MPHRVERFQPTPNPNAIKCVLAEPVAPPARSYRRREEAPDASSDPVGAALFAVPGVAGVLVNGGWITVSKEPSADWTAVKAGVRRALGSAP